MFFLHLQAALVLQKKAQARLAESESKRVKEFKKILHLDYYSKHRHIVKCLYKSRTFATFLLSQQSIPAGFATPGSGVSV